MSKAVSVAPAAVEAGWVQTGITALIGGQILALWAGLGPAMPHVKAGRLKVLAVTDSVRSPLVPDVPTVAEAAGLIRSDIASRRKVVAEIGAQVD